MVGVGWTILKQKRRMQQQAIYTVQHRSLNVGGGGRVKYIAPVQVLELCMQNSFITFVFYFCNCRLPADPMLLCSTTIIAITIALIPFCHSLSLLLIDMAVMGIFMGVIDTIANVSLLKIYGKFVSPFLQVKFSTIVRLQYIVIYVSKYI